MLYLALQPAAAGRPAATAQQLTVQRLLTDPALERLVGADPASAAAVALGFLRGVLGRVAGEIELVLLGIVPAGDGPAARSRALLALRAVLSAGDAGRMAELLRGRTLAQPLRQISGHQTFALNQADAHQAGELVEVAVVERALLVANDARAMAEMLGNQTVTRRPLA
ncbi:MAG TPA: hypothetical protein VK348_08585, partial [Planctomycetota bacterium]|nr:hypothetical protein [Planctomycetota bacterium]